MTDKVKIFNNEQINKKLHKKLKQYEDHVPATFEELLADYKEGYQQLSQAMDTNEGTIAENAWYQLKSRYSKSNTGTDFEGFILAMDEASDTVQSTREKKVNSWEQKGQDALKAGEIHLIKEIEDGNYKKLKWDRKNDELISNEGIDSIPKEAEQVASDKWVVPIRTEVRWDGDPELGEPLPEHNYLRNVFGICRPEEHDGEFKPFSMLLTGKEAEKGNVPLITPVKFNAFAQDDVEERDGVEEKQLRHTGGTEFKEIDGGLNIDLEEYIEEHLTQYVRTVSELDEFVDNQPENSYNYIVIATGRIQDMRLEPNDNGNRGFVLEADNGFSIPEYDDSDKLQSVYCSIRSHIDLDFGEGSYGYVIGTTFRGDPPEDSDKEKGDPLVMARGVYVPEDKKIPTPDEVEDVSEEDIDLGSSDSEDNEENEEEFSDEGVDFDVGDDIDDEW